MSKSGTESLWLTVGVAIYNVGAYLRDCLDSIAEQDLTGVEVILLDDGSTDDCPSICDEYAARLPAFTAVHQSNSGVSAARNAIIERSRGKWLTFVDGDDLLVPNALDTFRSHRDSDAEAVLFDRLVFQEKKPLPDYVPKCRPMALTERGELERHIAWTLLYEPETRETYGGIVIATIWGKLFRTEFLMRENIRFNPALPKAQDNAFTFLYTHLVKRLEIYPIPVYCYRRNSGSITVRFSPKMAEYCVELMNALYATMERFGDTDSPLVMNTYRQLVISQVRLVMDLGSHHPDCPWDKARRVAYIRSYCDQPFFAEAMAHYDEMPEHLRQQVPWKQLLLEHDYERLYDVYVARRRKGRMREALLNNPVGRCLLALRRSLLGRGKP